VVARDGTGAAIQAPPHAGGWIGAVGRPRLVAGWRLSGGIAGLGELGEDVGGAGHEAGLPVLAQRVVFGPRGDAGQIRPGGGDPLAVLPFGVPAWPVRVGIGIGRTSRVRRWRTAVPR